MKLSGAVHAVAAGLCAGLIFVMAACGGGSSFNGGGGGGGQQPTPLLITTAGLPTGISGIPYQQTLTATGGTPPYTWSQNGSLPTGLTLSPSLGVIAGTCPGAVFGPVVFQVSDSGTYRQTAYQTISMSFVWQLLFQTTSLPPAHINAPYDAVIDLTASADPTTWKLLSGTLPAGFQLSNPTAQQIEITGITTQTGSYPLALQVQDNSTPPQVAKQDFVLTADNALAVLTQKLGSAIVNSNYSVTLAAVNGTPPYQWSAVGLPAGLIIDPASGTLAGIPTQTGVFQPTFTVTDSAGHTASQVLGLSIISALFVPNYGNLSAVVNQSFYSILTAFGGLPPYTWSLVSGSLPPGLTLDGAHGYIAGTPTQLGSHNLTFQVTDTGPPQQTAQWPTILAVVPPTLVVSSSLPARLPLGVPVNWTAAAIGGTPPYHWSLMSGILPPGLSFNAATADLSGTPTTLGQYTFALQATDSGSPPQTSPSTYTVNITTPLGRNDTIAHATPLGDGSWLASISPYADPPDSPTPVPDTDYYKIIGNAGSSVSIAISAKASFWNNPLDSVLEIFDVNGAHLTTCQLPGDTSNNFNSVCLNDDIVQGVNQDSQLQIKVPGAANTQTTMYAHVLDWRGDARPDMQYFINVSGSIAPLRVSPPFSTIYGTGLTAPAACPVALACSAQFTATGGIQPLTWSVDSGNLPQGTTLNSATGMVSGTPTTTGPYSFVIRATDAGSPPQTATANYNLTIDTVPTVTTTTLPDAFTGQPYTYALTATGGTPPLHWTLGQYDYQLSMQIDPLTGVLTGVAHAPNTDPLFIWLVDPLGIGSNTQLTLNIKPGPFQFPNGSYPSGNVGVLYSTYANSGPVGGLPPYTISLLGGTVPPGLVFYGGALSGVPTTAGTYVLTLQATDSSPTPQTLTASYTITISP